MPLPRRRRPPRPGALTELPPLRILTQILALQALYYAVAVVMILFTTLVMGTPFRLLDDIFGWTALRGDTTTGWLLGMVWMANAFFIVIAILFIIQRSKLVLDFVITLHFVHLLLVSLYSHGLPRNWLWWALQVCSAVFMVVLGTWACQRRELRPIIFGGSAASPAEGGSASAGASGPSADSIGDEEAGFSRGGRRGRGRDGAGEYEMLPIKTERQEA
ncbi:hypothetical protein O988_01280 [Pseudogymnoascus sp. VKM F-3808]|nr:hypothetical protein O988_01280 [Pseudogymnoascus sp. VKM F-3808]